MKKIFISSVILLASAQAAFAQPSVGGNSGIRDLRSLITFVIDYINQGIYLLMALATVYFVYNIVQYFIVKTDADRKEAGTYLMYSIIGFAVILSFWGMVNVVIQTFSLNNTTKPNIQNLYFR